MSGGKCLEHPKHCGVQYINSYDDRQREQFKYKELLTLSKRSKSIGKDS